MQQFSDDFLNQWEHIINEVNKTEVPLECLKKVVIKLNNKKRKTINLQLLKRQGLEWEEIESIVSRTLRELEDEIKDIEFMLDIGAVVEMIQPQTNRLLKNL
jgi:hypothetical protein